MNSLSRQSIHHKTVTCSDVVDAYGALLERVPYGVGLSLPLSELPYDIALIKESLTRLAVLPEHSDKLAMLKAGFLELAAFLPNQFQPSGLVDSGPKLPTSREEIVAFSQKHGQELHAIPEIGARIAAKRELLEGEWNLRLTVQQVSSAERFSS
jgi:hypothetical protein